MKYLALILCLALGTASAQVFKWTDESGQVHYGDVPTKGAVVESVDVEINSYESVTYSRSDSGYAANRVVMYATSWCPYCRKAREYFERNGIPFTEYDIEQNQEARREYKKLGASGVPVILVGDKRMNGFSVEGFERLYR